MNSPPPGDIATWAAAVVALGAMLVTLRQTREARKARQAAEDQADAARRQADAAADQVAIMRAERDDRQAPVFTLVDAVDCQREAGTFAAKVVLEFASGPPLSSVTISAHGKYVGSPMKDLHQWNTPPMPLAFEKVRPGGALTFYLLCDDGYVGSQASADLECVEDGGDGRTWVVGVGFTIHPAPPPPRTTVARIR